MMPPEDRLVGKRRVKVEMIDEKKVRSKETHLTTNAELRTPVVKEEVVEGLSEIDE